MSASTCIDTLLDLFKWGIMLHIESGVCLTTTDNDKVCVFNSDALETGLIFSFCCSITEYVACYVDEMLHKLYLLYCWQKV